MTVKAKKKESLWNFFKNVRFFMRMPDMIAVIIGVGGLTYLMALANFYGSPEVVFLLVLTMFSFYGIGINKGIERWKRNRGKKVYVK